MNHTPPIVFFFFLLSVFPLVFFAGDYKFFLFFGFLFTIISIVLSSAKKQYYLILISTIYLIPFFILWEALVFGFVSIDRGAVLAVEVLNNKESLYFQSELFFYTSFGAALAISISLVFEKSFPDKIYFSRMTQGHGKVFSILTFFSVILIFIFMAPSESIIGSSYVEVRASGGGGGFSGLGYLLYAFVILFFIVGERSFGRHRKLYFFLGLLMASFALVYVDILRGDRRSVALWVAVIYLIMTRPALNYDNYSFSYSIRDGYRKEVLLLAVLVLPAAIFLFVFPAVRSVGFSDIAYVVDDIVYRLQAFYKTGTWMGAYRSVVGLSVDGEKSDFLYGATYFSYLLYLPPSFIYSLMPFERPDTVSVFAAHWYLGYTAGGTHPTVPAFRNFGFFGVFWVSFLIISLYAFVQRRSLKGSMLYRLVLGCMVMSAMHWFWYGDMYFIRAMMACFIAYGFYVFINSLVSRASA